jgi:hypothetical protein
MLSSYCIEIAIGDLFVPFIYSSVQRLRSDLSIAETWYMGKGAQGTWCATHDTWCTMVAVTCDNVSKVHKGGTKRLKNYYISM